MHKVLITGGFGALGSNVRRYLEAAGGYDIHVIDNLSAGLVNYSPRIKSTYLDISNGEKVRAFFAMYKPDFIFHLAAHFANQNSVDHPVSDASTNIIGLIHLFEAQRRNPKLRKIVYASSSCVYGNVELMSENASVSPFDTPYAISKYAGELYSSYYSKIQNVPAVCIRIFNIFGPGEMPGSYRNVIPNFIRKAIVGEDITITGTGDETRDFTYVDDVVAQLLSLANSDYSNAEVFNGGTGHKTSIRDLAEMIIDVAESSSQIFYVPARSWDKVKDRRSDTSKSRDLLGYQPSTELRGGLEKTVAWIRTQMQATGQL